MNTLAWILFGIVIGIIAQALDPEPRQGGMYGTVLLGIVGALFGGFLAELLFGRAILGFNPASFLLAAGGSLMVLLFGRIIVRA